MLFSEPKIPQCWDGQPQIAETISFSALQRAENSSIAALVRSISGPRRFSALQRAENSSIVPPVARVTLIDAVSVLFSEPKIPQFIVWYGTRQVVNVSVLFSEPKIPQFDTALHQLGHRV